MGKTSNLQTSEGRKQKNNNQHPGAMLVPVKAWQRQTKSTWYLACSVPSGIENSCKTYVAPRGLCPRSYVWALSGVIVSNVALFCAMFLIICYGTMYWYLRVMLNLSWLSYELFGQVEWMANVCKGLNLSWLSYELFGQVEWMANVCKGSEFTSLPKCGPTGSHTQWLRHMQDCMIHMMSLGRSAWSMGQPSGLGCLPMW